jgi:hypothetical protein
MTATTVERGLDIASLHGLDFDIAVPCEWNREAIQRGETRPTCPNEAEWRVVGSCCGAVWLICDEHFWKQVKACQMGNVAHFESVGGCGAINVKIASATRLDKRN